MKTYPETINKLLNTLSHLPGLGPKSAERIVFHFLKQDDKFTREFVKNLTDLKKEIKTCSQCFNITVNDPCFICQDTKRDCHIICVIAEPQDVLIIEKTGEYKGLFHILGGVLNPVEGITPDKLKIKELISRIKTSPTPIKEIIIATNPDLEGESTAMYLTRHLKPLNIKISRLAKGLPMGSTIEYADEVTVSNALKGRQTL
ncbi:recombination mediator RecR [Patescibacteria group bacterium]|nr:recombination mediator RecR [Patescibacteria group bacterium]MBU0964234.1 recombination mediator RecR [Patescibacteria group bacterium]